MKTWLLAVTVPLLIGGLSLRATPKSRLLLFTECSTCVEPCVYGNPATHETIGPTGNMLGPPHSCWTACDCTCHAACDNADNNLLNTVFTSSASGDREAFTSALRKVGQKAHLNVERGVIQFEGCAGHVAAQLAIPRDYITMVRSVLSD